MFYQSINQKLPSRIFPAHLAWKVEDTENGAVVSALNCLNDKSVEFQCSKTILALPFFVRKRIFNLEKELASFSYAPWVVVNIHIENFEEELGYWDNVPFESKSLGYIVSTHQDLKGTVANQKTLTWYLPLVNSDPVAERKSAREKEASYWIEQAVLDIEKMHERIREYVTGAEAWVWGHGMVRPVPGMIWGEERNAAKSREGNVHFAHSDLSGMSVFEEAFYQGIRAACEVANLPFPGELKS